MHIPIISISYVVYIPYLAWVNTFFNLFAPGPMICLACGKRFALCFLGHDENQIFSWIFKRYSSVPSESLVKKKAGKIHTCVPLFFLPSQMTTKFLYHPAGPFLRTFRSLWREHSIQTGFTGKSGKRSGQSTPLWEDKLALHAVFHSDRFFRTYVNAKCLLSMHHVN